MSIPKSSLCALPFLFAAGAAGFALGRADVRTSAPPACDFVPFTWPPTLDATEYQRYYPIVKLSVRKREDLPLIPVTGGACLPEGQSWQAMPPVGPASKCYNPSALLMPDGRVLQNVGSATSIDPSPPAPPSDR